VTTQKPMPPETLFPSPEFEFGFAQTDVPFLHGHFPLPERAFRPSFSRLKIRSIRLLVLDCHLVASVVARASSANPRILPFGVSGNDK
jgi:hypothetical protein